MHAYFDLANLFYVRETRYKAENHIFLFILELCETLFVLLKETQITIMNVFAGNARSSFW